MIYQQGEKEPDNNSDYIISKIDHGTCSGKTRLDEFDEQTISCKQYGRSPVPSFRLSKTEQEGQSSEECDVFWLYLGSDGFQIERSEPHVRKREEQH